METMVFIFSSSYICSCNINEKLYKYNTIIDELKKQKQMIQSEIDSLLKQLEESHYKDEVLKILIREKSKKRTEKENTILFLNDNKTHGWIRPPAFEKQKVSIKTLKNSNIPENTLIENVEVTNCNDKDVFFYFLFSGKDVRTEKVFPVKSNTRSFTWNFE